MRIRYTIGMYCHTSVVSCGGWNRTNMKTFERLILPLDDPADRMLSRGHDCSLTVKFGEGGLEPPSPGSRPGEPTARRSPIIIKSATTTLRRCPESNPLRQPTNLRSVPEAGASAGRPRAHKAEGGGVEPSRLIARPLSRRLPSPVGLTFRITRLRWQESNLRRDA